MFCLILAIVLISSFTIPANISSIAHKKIQLIVYLWITYTHVNKCRWVFLFCMYFFITIPMKVWWVRITLGRVEVINQTPCPPIFSMLTLQSNYFILVQMLTIKPYSYLTYMVTNEKRILTRLEKNKKFFHSRLSFGYQ